MEPESINNFSAGKLIIIILSIILVAVVVGGGIYYWQQVRIDNLPEMTEVDYNSAIDEISKEVAATLVSITNISKDKTEPIYWTDEDLTELDNYIDMLVSLNDRTIDLSAPEKYVTFHNLFLSELEKYNQAMPIYREGVANADKAKILQAAEMIDEALTIEEQAQVEKNKVEQAVE
ncbi:MAG: hypothetical protein ACD_7C00520G0003 [uncultured bacterium]|nr:MAG: hypothetical protein ACD_7C00520G0003 [uncultured bacterium]